MMTTINFGKQKSKTIQEVYASDLGYCRWLKLQPHLINDDIAKFLDTNFAQDDGSYIMSWGKYKNKIIKQINGIDRSYIEWLAKNQFVIDKCPKILDAIEELFK